MPNRPTSQRHRFPHPQGDSTTTQRSRIVVFAAIIALIAFGAASCSAPFPEPTPATRLRTFGPLHGYVEAENGSIAGYQSLGAEPTGLSGYEDDVLLFGPDQSTRPNTNHSYSLDDGRYVGYFTVIGPGPVILTVISEADGHGLMGAGDEIRGRAIFIIASPVGTKLRIEGEVGQDVHKLRMEIDSDDDGAFEDSIEPNIVRTGDDLDGYWDSRTSATIKNAGPGKAQVSLVPTYGEEGIDQTYFWVFPSNPMPSRYSEPFVLTEPSYVLFTSFDPEGKQQEMEEAWVLGGAPTIDETIKSDEVLVITFDEPGRVAHLTFEGYEGQRIVPQSLGSNLSPFPCCSGSMRVLRPNGKPLTQPFGVATGLSVMPTVVLPEDGKYTLSVDPYLAYTGQVNVILDQLTDVSARIELDDPPRAIAFDHREQRGFVTFEGAAGQHVSVVVERPETSRCCTADVAVLSPSGTSLVGDRVRRHYHDIVTLRIVLPEDGKYTIELDPYVEYPGDLMIAAYPVSDIEAELILDESAKTVEITTPGQTAELLFKGVAGQKIYISAVDEVAVNPHGGLGYGDSRTRFSVLTSRGVELVRSWLSPQGVNTISTVLPAAGEYTVLIDPPDKRTGSMEIALLQSSPDVPRLTARAISVDGTSKKSVIDDPELRVQWSFTGKEGQMITLKIDDVSVKRLTKDGAFWPRLFGPDGNELSCDAKLATFSRSLTTSFQLPSTGTYVLDIESYKTAATGSFNVSVTLNDSPT